MLENLGFSSIDEADEGQDGFVYGFIW